MRLVALPGVDGIKSFRALLKTALRRFGLRAIDVRELHAHNPPDEPQPGSLPMSAFSDRVRSQKKGMFKVADFDGGKELTLTISRLDEEVEIFGEIKDILNFEETGQQLALNQTTAEWLINNLGDDPETWPGQKVVLYLGEYEFNREKKFGIRLKMLGQASPATQALPLRRQVLDDDIPF